MDGDGCDGHCVARVLEEFDCAGSNQLRMKVASVQSSGASEASYIHGTP